MRLLFLYDEDKRRCMNFVQGFSFSVQDNRLLLEISHQLPEGFFSLDDKPDIMRLEDALAVCHSKVLSISAIIGNNGSGKTMVARSLGDVLGCGFLHSGVCVVVEREKDIIISGTKGFDDISDAKARLQALGYRIADWRDADAIKPPCELIYYTPFCANYKLWSASMDWRHELSPAAYFDQKTIEESSIVYPNKFSRAAQESTLGKYNRYLQGIILEFIGDMYANGLDTGIHSSFPMPKQAIIGDERMTTVDLQEELENKQAEGNVVTDVMLRDKYKNYLDASVSALKINTMPCTILLAASLLISRHVFSLDDDKFRQSGFISFLQGIIQFAAYIQKRREMESESLAVTWHQFLTDSERENAYEQIAMLLKRLAKDRTACELVRWDKLSIVWQSLVKIAIEQDGDVDDDMMLCSLKDKEQRSIFIDLMLAHSQMGLGVPFINATIANISSGELSYLSMFARLHQVMKKIGCARTAGATSSKSKDILLFIDEAETTMHPGWQRQLVSNIIWYLEGFTCNVRAHVIFASHSPILLSDIPSGNVVYLNIPAGQEESSSSFNTFGANIFDLYRMPFLMIDGPVGRFASGKINATLKKIASQLIGGKGLKKVNIEPNEKALLGMIGDPVVKKYIASLEEAGLL